MELLDIFEEKIQAMIAEMQRLRADNDILRAELSSCKLIIEENKEKMAELTHEQNVNEELRQRIETLLHKVQRALPQ